MRALILAIVIASVPAPAPALGDDTSKTEAIALFDEGLQEMKAGNLEKACNAFRKSNELHADSGTRGSLARCYERLGKVVSAWRLWTDLSTTAPKHLRADAAANAAKLEPRLPKYTLKNSTQMSITIDGVAVDATPDVASPIDPGDHVLEVTAAGFTGWKHAFTAVEGKNEDIRIPALKPVAVATPQPQPGPIVDEEPASHSRRRTIGLAMLGVGGALAVTGVVFGVVARGKFHDAQDLCGDIDACGVDQVKDAQAKVDAARTAGNVSTVMVIGGGVAIAAGIVLIVTAPKHGPRVAITPALGADGAGFVVSGGF